MSTQARASASLGSAFIPRANASTPSSVPFASAARYASSAPWLWASASHPSTSARAACRAGLLEQRVELRLVRGLDEDDGLLARRQDDHDLGAERGRDIGAPVESLLAEGRIDCSREGVPRARDPLEHLGGVRPLVRAVVGDRRDVGERVRRGERRRLRDLGGARLGARAPGDERDDGEKHEDGKDAPHDEKYRPVTAEPQSASARSVGGDRAERDQARLRHRKSRRLRHLEPPRPRHSRLDPVVDLVEQLVDQDVRGDLLQNLAVCVDEADVASAGDSEVRVPASPGPFTAQPITATSNACG